MDMRLEAGSSPLARGKLFQAIGDVIGNGFIPTRAGKIWFSFLPGGFPPVHPHSRGEN